MIIARLVVMPGRDDETILGGADIIIVDVIVETRAGGIQRALIVAAAPGRGAGGGSALVPLAENVRGHIQFGDLTIPLIKIGAALIAVIMLALARLLDERAVLVPGRGDAQLVFGFRHAVNHVRAAGLAVPVRQHAVLLTGGGDLPDLRQVMPGRDAQLLLGHLCSPMKQAPQS